MINKSGQSNSNEKYRTYHLSDVASSFPFFLWCGRRFGVYFEFAWSKLVLDLFETRIMWLCGIDARLNLEKVEGGRESRWVWE
jgi:hypothetical protein